MKVKILSIGCRLNQAEMQSVATRLQELGHDMTNHDDADVFIVNSCVVTRQSERKTRNLIYRALKAAGCGEGKRIIVTGCAAESSRSDGNMVYVSNDHKHLIPDLIEDRDLFNGERSITPSRFGYATPVKAARTRVHLKIQDGCDNFCAYCIVPQVRGMPQSKPAGQVMNELIRLLDAGYREIVITGVMIGKYSWEGDDLSALVTRFVGVPGNFRVHLSSLNPGMVNSRLLDLVSSDKVVKHLHLSLQSGSNAVLRKMNRHYTREEYLAVVESIRETVPLFNITTDLIVGFPGETESDFRDSISLIRDAGFSHVHTFRFSPRPGTAAAAMPGQVPEGVKRERSEEVMALCNRQKIDYYRKFDGMGSVFLSERFRSGLTSGFNEYYAPVVVPGFLERNRFYKVRTVLDEEHVRLTGSLAG